jgi:predicted DCC family thiol-disulfide oxidoreductase YuxK
MSSSWTGGQYSVYRALLGAFLIVHFAMLLPYGAEVFGAGGTLSAATLSPYIGVLPNPLTWFDAPGSVVALLIVGIVCGALLAVGYLDRTAAVLAALLLGWLYQRNPLIANPSLPLLGWLLVMHAFTPPRPYGSLAGVVAGADPDWRLPRHLYLAAWIVLAIAYSHSGYTKLLSPSWLDGETIRLVLENPLARAHTLRDLVLALPPIVLQVLTWTVLWIEVLFAPLVLVRRLRPLMWMLMLFAQLGFLCFLNFADLTFPMLLAHLITFDPRWVRRWTPQTRGLLLFDGDCAFCHAAVRFAIREDEARRLSFAPLSGELARSLLARAPLSCREDTIVFIHAGGREVKARAVAGILMHAGGLWLLAGKVLWLMPTRLANAAYDFVGRIRYRLGGRRENACALLPADRLARQWPAPVSVCYSTDLHK